MPTAAHSIRREHAEAFIAAELERTAPSSSARGVDQDHPVEMRQLRTLLRHRINLSPSSRNCANQIHAVAADHSYDR